MRQYIALLNRYLFLKRRKRRGTIFSITSDPHGVPCVKFKRFTLDNRRSGTDVQSELSSTVPHSKRYEVTSTVSHLTTVQH